MIFKIFDKTIYLDGATGIFAFDSETFNQLLSKNNTIFDSLKPNFYECNTSSVTFCINISNACNLRCDYCFNQTKDDKSILLSDAFAFLNTCFKTFPNKEKYFVDLSGKGEPLLFLKKIIEIKKYCESKSNEIKREVLVQFVCNGTLLDALTADILQKNGILFGVSLDGNKYIHDKHRKTKDGDATFNKILQNINSILHHEYVGVACTLTNDVFSLTESMIELSKTFNTISYKPCRNCEFAIDNCSIDEWLESYNELIVFLKNQTIRGNLKYIKTILNGDDYLGKFIKRIVLRQRNIIRCDAGIGRFTLDDDGYVYACPASCKNQTLRVGTKDKLYLDKVSLLFSNQIRKDGCQKCDFRNICGGECQVEQIFSKGINKVMCKYKSHLVLLAIYFVNEVAENNSLSFEEIYNFCIDVDNRRRLDNHLQEFLAKHPEYSFVEGKKIYDKIVHKY